MQQTQALAIFAAQVVANFIACLTILLGNPPSIDRHSAISLSRRCDMNFRSFLGQDKRYLGSIHATPRSHSLPA